MEIWQRGPSQLLRVVNLLANKAANSRAAPAGSSHIGWTVRPWELVPEEAADLAEPAEGAVLGVASTFSWKGRALAAGSTTASGSGLPHPARAARVSGLTAITAAGGFGSTTGGGFLIRPARAARAAKTKMEAPNAMAGIIRLKKQVIPSCPKRFLSHRGGRAAFPAQNRSVPLVPNGSGNARRSMYIIHGGQVNVAPGNCQWYQGATYYQAIT